MSNDVVISKELRDHIVWCGEHGHGVSLNEAKELREAPETVSLEEMERMKLYQWLNSQENGETELARVSDIRRLFVQPSAVVSLEAVDLGDWSEIIEADGTDENGRDIRESWVRKIEAEEAIYQLSLQLPQPVAPVHLANDAPTYEDGINEGWRQAENEAAFKRSLAPVQKGEKT
jgi:hypothetical protein